MSSTEKERLRKVERMRENHAALKIQRGWRKHHNEDLAEEEVATLSINYRRHSFISPFCMVYMVISCYPLP